VSAYLPYIKAFANKETEFKFRGRTYNFSLSQGLFSSADIDTGSRFLLKVFSQHLDKAIKAGTVLPRNILDAGSGVGVLGICAAGAIDDISRQAPVPVYSTEPRSGEGSPLEKPGNDSMAGCFHVRAQDRDELARIFTTYNAERNGILNSVFQAHTEPLLSGPQDMRWDLILSNIPAKAGPVVLEDFIHRSAAILKKEGKVFLVAVNTLADFFRSQIVTTGAPLIIEETGKEHTVFVYGSSDESNQGGDDIAKSPLAFDESFPWNFYIRNKNTYEMEDIVYNLDTVHGAQDFDSPSGRVQAAAKLAVKTNLASMMAKRETAETSLLVYDEGQGHFALWLASYIKDPMPYRWVLSGRNVLALAASRTALNEAKTVLVTVKTGIAANRNSMNKSDIKMIPAVDIFLDRERITTAGKFDLVAFFPEKAAENAWEGLAFVAKPNSIVIVGMASAEAERFDRKKPLGWNRLGDIKRKGFRALMYQLQSKQ
jgi:hypothetical protein